MPKFFAIIGETRDDEYPNDKVVWWPVCLRFDEAEAITVRDTCIAQRDLFLEELKPIWAEIEQIKQRGKSTSYGRSKRRVNLDAVRAQETRARKECAKLYEREAEVNRRYASEMLDPLYPTSTSGYAPDDLVVYRIIEFWEDPREMGAMGLLKLRAMLHGGQTSEDPEVEYDEAY